MDELELMTGTPIELPLSILTPTVLSFEPVHTTAHYTHGVDCAFCGRHGQFALKLDGKYVNYCPGCELTWIYRRTSKD